MDEKTIMREDATRHDFFQELLKDIFTRADVQYKYNNSIKKWEVRIGETSKLVGDCNKSYSLVYKEKFLELFKICFLDPNVYFSCTRKKQKVDFSREDIIANSIKYLSKYGVKICNQLHVKSEIDLLSNYVYKYIVSLVDVIFDINPNLMAKERNDTKEDNISEAFMRKISALVKQNAKNDIIGQIYTNALKNDIEMIFDPDYDEDECNYALCISLNDKTFDINNNMSMNTEIRYIEREIKERWYGIDGYYEENKSVVFTLCDWSKEENQKEMYQQPWKYMIKGFEMYPFSEKSLFKPPKKSNDIKSYKLFDLDKNGYQLPQYFYFVTKISKEELKSKYSHIYDNPS